MTIQTAQERGAGSHRVHRSVALMLLFAALCGLALALEPKGPLGAASGGPGDCNDDTIVDAGDVSAIVLEIFDGDGILPENAPGGSFVGDPEGCDTNGDVAIDAGDISCTILRIFGGPDACGPPVTPTATASPTDAASVTPTSTVTPSATHTSSPTPTASQTASPTPYVAPDTPFGVQVFARDVSPIVIGHLTDSGVARLRARLLWSQIEPEDTNPPRRDWSVPDAALGPLAERGLPILAVIYHHPTWAASRSCGMVDLAPLSDYQAFVAAAVERYDGDGFEDAPGSPRVTWWQLGNEADFDPDAAGGEADYGSCFGGQPAAYGAYLRAGYEAVKGADPTASVLFAGIAYDRFHNKSDYTPVGPFDYGFVRDVLTWLHDNYASDPDWPFFDAMALHVYNDYRNYWDGTAPYDQEMIGKVKHFRNNQLFSSGVFDLRSMPLHITEASLPSMPGDAFTQRSEDLQAAYPGQVLARAMSLDLPSVIWFSMEDHRTGSCSIDYDWIAVGLLRSLGVFQAAQACPVNPLPDYTVSEDHEPKPALEAYGVATRLLGGTTFDRQLSTAETGSSLITAFRFTDGTGAYRIVAFTDNGERLGRIGAPPVERTMSFDATVLPDWTGQLAVTDYIGATSHYTGTSVAVRLTQWPAYVQAE